MISPSAFTTKAISPIAANGYIGRKAATTAEARATEVHSKAQHSLIQHKWYNADAHNTIIINCQTLIPTGYNNLLKEITGH